MFERYTEKARRVIFFARYEASLFGGRAIESEHLLLGLLHEDKNLVRSFAPDWPLTKHIRAEIRKRVTIGEKLPVTVDLPLSLDCKRILTYALNEAEYLKHRYVSTEHLLIGMLRETDSLAAEILRGHGLNLDAVQTEIATRPMPEDVPAPPPLLEDGCVPDPETAKRIAEAVWIPIYGEDAVEEQKPLRAELANDIWTVRGTPPSGRDSETLVVVISKADSRILKIGTSVFYREFPE